MPLLASIPSPDNGVIDLGPIPLHAYGLLLAIGVLVAAWIAERRWVARGFDGKTFNDMAVWIVVAGVVGARVYHVISDYQLFTDDWLRAFQIWKGGLSIWGVLAGGVIAVVVLTRIKHVETLARHSGQTVERIERDIDRDFILRGPAAVEYGLVDHVIESRQLTAVGASPNGSSPAPR